MTLEVVASLTAVILTLVGLVGIVFPVLPGSILVGAGALAWAIWGASRWGWVAFGVAAFLLVVGASSSLLLSGRSLQPRQVPKWPFTVGIVVGIVGMFVLPGLGLPIGFVLGLLLGEWHRMRDFRQATVTSRETFKALGLDSGRVRLRNDSHFGARGEHRRGLVNVTDQHPSVVHRHRGTVGPPTSGRRPDPPDNRPRSRRSRWEGPAIIGEEPVCSGDVGGGVRLLRAGDRYR